MQDQNNLLGTFVQSPFGGADKGDMPPPSKPSAGLQTGDGLPVSDNRVMSASGLNSFAPENNSQLQEPRVMAVGGQQPSQVPTDQMPPPVTAVTQPMASFLPGTANLNQGGNMFNVSFDPVTHNPFDQNSATNKTGLYA